MTLVWEYVFDRPEDEHDETGPTGHSGNDNPLISMRHLPPSATLTPPGYEEPIVSAVSSTTTRWSPDLGGRGSRHPHADVPTSCGSPN